MPLQVSFNGNSWDRKVKQLTLKGFTVDVICKHTGLSISQVRYRQMKGGVSSMDYRRGDSEEAVALLRRIDQALGSAREMQRRSRKLLRGH